MVADLVGSTSFRVGEGDAAADAMLVKFERLVEELVSSSDGRVVANHGDGFLTSFSSATAALRCAATLRSAVASIELDGGVRTPAMRIGLSAGDVVERGREMFGLPVVIAARLEAVAEPGEIVCSDLVRSLAGSRSPVEFMQRRRLDLKGIPESVEVWTVLAPDTEELHPVVHHVVEWRDELPVVANRFFGRDRERSALPAQITPGSITTLLGPGGVGKTRLSLELAHDLKADFPDGVWFVELESATTLEDVVSAVGRTMRLPTATMSHGAAELGASLRSLDALVILDNCEQVIDEAAQVARSLVADGSRVAVLTSSREVLGLRQEVVWPLAPLEVGDGDAATECLSAELFIDRAMALNATVEFSAEDRVAIGQIVESLEGLPLAIELAASRLNVFTPGEMARRSAELITLLGQRDRDRPQRHQTLRNTVDWSITLLNERERMLLVGMAAFAGGAELDAIAAVNPDAGAMPIDLLGSLVDKSLLRRRPDGSFRMLAVIRESVRDREDSVGRLAEAAQLHFEYFAGLAREGSNLVQHDPAWLARFGREHDNLMAALDHAVANDPTQALRMAGNLALYWVLSGNASEGDRRFAHVLESAGGADPAVLAAALRGAGMAAALDGRYDRSAQLFADARARYEELGRVDAVGYCDHWVARNTVVQVHFGLLPKLALDEAQRRLESAVAGFRTAGDDFGVLLSYPYLGWTSLLQGDHAAADRLTEELLELAGAAGVSLVRAYALGHAAFIHLSIGDLDVAQANMSACLDSLQQSGDTQNLVITAFVNTALQLRRDDQVAAVDAGIELADHALACDSTEWEPAVLAILAHLLAELGDWDDAGVLGDALERRHPTWRAVLRNSGIDPEITLEHVVASRAPVDEQLSASLLLRMAKRALLARRRR